MVSGFLASFERAQVLAEHGDLTEAADAYAAAVEMAPSDPDVAHRVATALLHRGICLEAVGDHAAAIEGYDDLVARFGGDDDPVIRDLALRARVNRAAAVLSTGRPGDAIGATDDLLVELDPTDALEAEQFATTARVRAAALRALDRTEDAAAALEAVERCADEDPAARSQVAAARRERAEILIDLGRIEQAIALLDRAVERLRADPDPLVADALVGLVETEVAVLESTGDERADSVRGLLDA